MLPWHGCLFIAVIAGPAGKGMWSLPLCAPEQLLSLCAPETAAVFVCTWTSLSLDSTHLVTEPHTACGPSR